MRRDDGYAALRDPGARDDGRTLALAARDRSINWLSLPNLDSPSTLAAPLDSKRGASGT